ncbi:MAG TPA: NUDIX domain-containing protein [Longimicrobiaceae bacterium]
MRERDEAGAGEGRRAEVEVTVDVATFTLRGGALHVLLVRRGIEPFRGRWALPGGFVLEDETLEAAALRELREETAVPDVYLEQLYTFGDPGRDPRGRVVTVAYYALVAHDRVAPEAGSDAAETRWWPVDALPDPLAFDHAHVLEYAVGRLRGKLEYTTVGFELLPERFTLAELQEVYEAILGRPLDKRNFRRRVEALDELVPLEEWRRGEPSRPARLYSFRGGRRAGGPS